MRLIFLGPPGAGKGTIANRMVEELGVVTISTGDLLRAAVAAGSELGRRAKSFMDAGELVPDDLVINLLRERIAQPDCAGGFILDGFPRTIPQAEALEKAGVAVDRVVNFQIVDALLVRRLSGRRIHRPTGKIYNVNPDGVPRPPENVAASEFYQRDDDKPEAISNRLVVYRRQTAPLIEYYARRKLLVDIDAAADIGQILDAVRKALGVAPGKK
jgi:adenylate kinase